MNQEPRAVAIIFFFFALVIGIFLPSDSVNGQTFRYELGRRVKRFENAWQVADAESRKRCTQSMQTAVGSFFSFEFQKAGQAVDQAWFQVQSIESPSDASAWASSQRLSVSNRVSDASTDRLEFSIEPFYESTSLGAASATVQVSVSDQAGNLLHQSEHALPESGSPVQCQLSEPAVAAGDFSVKTTLLVGQEEFVLDEFLYSRVEGLSERLQKLNEQISATKTKASPTGYQTLKMWRQQIEESCDIKQTGQRTEIDFPVHELFENIDRLCQLDGDSVEFIKTSPKKEFWLTLRRDRKSVPLRVQLPKDISRPRPVLFVFHGAGGSDNMFFETYGAGRCIELAEQRGWIVVSPNQGLLSRLQLDCKEILSLLGEHVAVDEQQVFLLGHSMGAGQVVRQANSNPDLPAAAVAIGGGRGLRDASPLSGIPWFVAAGEMDFGRPGAKALHNSLKRAEADSTYKEYKDVEHMVIVQAALDDVFEFLDTVAASLNAGTGKSRSGNK